MVRRFARFWTKGEPDSIMPTTSTSKEIAGGFVLAGVTLCLGVYFGLKVEGEGGTALLRLFYLLSIAIVLKVTFAWGRQRGFPARLADGTIALGHVLRSLTMAVIVWGVLVLVFAPFFLLAFKLAR
jgi:hypothetical protein